ncbi:MAG: putative bifunctional diguanylate cyclase/phosphodiesterase [Actinomycetota bacterium]
MAKPGQEGLGRSDRSEPVEAAHPAGATAPSADPEDQTVDPILGAVGFAASEFLRARSWEDCMEPVMRRLGQAARVSRVSVFQNHTDRQGNRTFSRRFEWVGEGASPQIDRPAFQQHPWGGAFRRWRDVLTAGGVIHGAVASLPEQEREILEQQDILSVAAAPIPVGDDWWGLLTLDDCVTVRDWSEGEIEALQAAGETLGSAVARKRTELALRETEVRYRTLVEQIPAIVYIAGVGESGDWLYVSPQIEAILGYTPDEWLAHSAPFSSFLHLADRERVLAEEAFSGATGEPLRSEFRMMAKDGRVVWIRDEAHMVEDETGRPLLWQGLMSDITDLKRAEEQVAFLAYHDKLTRLPNRAMFEELLDLALSRARRKDLAVAVLFMDLDNFKLVNDSLGHEAGDELLQQMGARLKEALRETDVVARQGGDEFLVLLSDLERGSQSARPDTETAVVAAETIAERIHEVLRRPFAVGGTEFYISASIGISLFPLDGNDGKTLLKNADAAMYRSKRSAPGGFTVFSKESVDPLTKLSLATRLRRAVERKEWTLHYQPIVDLRDAHLVSVEALLRWQDPSTGMVPPGEFIPLAEEMGLIEVIGDWVLEEVCRQSMAWRREGLMIEVSFNLSPRQLWHGNLVGKIIGHLQWMKINPRSVLVEITESTAMTDPDRTIRILEELHGAGLRLAIDDFGTGYSSLSRLKHMPVDILKIDRSFIRDIPADAHAMSMVKAIIQLAHGLGMVPLAEGIETEEQWRFLAENGCTLGQGFYFSRPVPASDISQRYVWGVAESPA